jgi:hypothetical protein
MNATGKNVKQWGGENKINELLLLDSGVMGCEGR